MRQAGEREWAKALVSGATALLGLAWTTSSLATPAVNVRVHVAPPECVGADELRERLRAFPQSPDGAQPIDVGVELRTDEPTGYLADVVVQSEGRGTQLRSVATQSSNCRDLDDALLVVIDALVTGAALDEPAPEKPAPARPAALPARDRRAPTKRVQRAAHPRVSHSASLGMALELGALPGVNASARLDTRLALAAHATVRLGFGMTPWTSTRTLQTARVDFRLMSGRALGCFDFLAAPWGYLDACTGLDAGVVATTAEGLSSAAMTTRPAIWAATEAGAGFLVGPLLAEITGFFGPALARDRYRATDTSGGAHTLHRTAALRWAVGLSLGAPLP